MIRTAYRSVSVAFLAIAVAAAAGCSTTTETATSTPQSTGFLSTYRHLEPSSPASLSYLDPNNRLARYKKFIVMPVEVRMYEGSDLTSEEIREIKSYMHDALVDALSERYQVVSEPTWDAAEVRIAVTDIRKSTPILNVIPRPKVLNLGLGAMSMEGEVMDSVSTVQIAALIESRTGQNRFIDFTQLDDTKAVMDEWAVRFRNMVDTAHGYATAE